MAAALAAGVAADFNGSGAADSRLRAGLGAAAAAAAGAEASGAAASAAAPPTAAGKRDARVAGSPKRNREEGDLLVTSST